MDNVDYGYDPCPDRREASSSSINALRAFTGPPLRPAQPSVTMMTGPHVRTGSHPVADVKPRLTKEQHDILENHFIKQAKPTTNTKKGFAEGLGVPLDKINNWFQNRRAKVKQDAKKAQNQQLMYAQTMGMYSQQPQQQQQQAPPQPQPASMPNPSSYFPPHTNMAPATRPLDNPMGGLNAQFNLQAAQYNDGLTSISEAGQQSSIAIMQAMMAAGYNLDDPSSQQNQLDNFDTRSYGSDVSTGAPFLSSLAIPSSGFDGSLDFSTFASGSTGMQPNNSLGSASTDPNSFMGTQFTPATQSCSSARAAGSVTSLPLYDDDSDAPDEVFNPGFNFQGMPRHHAASSSQISLPIFPPNHFAASGMYQQSNHSSQVIISSPDNFDHFASFDDLEPPNPPFAQGVSRRSSSTSNLADTMQNTGIESRGSPDNGDFKQPAPPVSIATRRQRRPAPLGSSGTRSASYTPGMPGSPNGSSSGMSTSEQNLRRIRSSQGMNGGRIQKNSSSGSAQHSPITLAFNQAASSPKFARQAAGYVNAVTTPSGNGGNGAFAPPTPQTPNELTRFPSWQAGGEIKPQPSLADTSSPPDSLGLTFSTESSSDRADGRGASPQTPADSYAQNQNLAAANATTYRDTPPQSAPATQQNFAQAMYMPQNQNHNQGDFLAPNEFAMTHMRSPSLPESAGNAQVESQIQQFGMQNFNPAADMHMSYPLQFSTGNGFGMPMYPMDSTSAMSSAGASSHLTGSASDFFVHEYAPPSSTGRKAELRRQPEQPKQFTFANAGPNDYKHGS